MGSITRNTLKKVITTGRTVDPKKWIVGDAIAKLLEEGGELSKAAQTKMGKLAKKLEPDEVFLECADVIMCALDVVGQTYLDLTPEEIIEKVIKGIDAKVPKWEQVIVDAGTGKQNDFSGWEYYAPEETDDSTPE